MKLAIVGYGKIGQAIERVLKVSSIDVQCYDTNPLSKCHILTDMADLDEYDTICCALPWYATQDVAVYCAAENKTYLDLTEDTKTTEFIQNLDTVATMIPQCGLAPGAVNIKAHQMAMMFEEVHDIQLKVGALPQFPNNEMKYNPTWSPAGVINEYCNPCDAVVDGVYTTVQPLEGLETVLINGVQYEAFNTSGGVGTLHEIWDQKANNISYKTIRYPGHRDYMKFLLKDLRMADNKEMFTELLSSVPSTTQDVVHLYIKVIGIQKGEHKESVYQRSIYGSKNLDLTAIENTTAHGVCAWIHELKNGFNKPGFIHQTEFKADVTHHGSNKFWKLYD